MITPNFDNIDRWLFDYVEGNLSSEQESLLENYILNHPELEVDLDMWKMSNIKMSNSFVNDIQIQKKTVNRRVFAIINTIGIIIILLIGRQIHFNDPLNSVSPVLSENRIKNSKELSIDIQQPERINDNKSSIKKDVKSSSSDYLATELPPSFYKKPKKSIGLMDQEIFQVSESFNVNNLLVERLFVNQDLELAKHKTNISIGENSDLSSDAKESRNSESNSFSIKDKTKEVINKIDHALSKNVALSNYRDHHYLIPQTSSIDANLSSIGSVSQTRFQSISRIRWMESDQRKLSQQITFDTYARGIRSGVGAQVNYDYYADGSIKDWNGALIVSPKIAISRNILIEPVAKLKIGNKLLDRDKVENNSLAVFNSDSPQLFSYDSSQNVGRKLWYRDLDIGFTLNTNIFYIGAQASNILNHSENIYQNTESTNFRTPTVYSIFAGTQYVSRNEKLSFHPYFYMRSANKNNQYFGGFSLDLDKLYIGAAADFNDQYSGSIGLSLDRFALILQSTKSYIPTLNQHLYTHQLTIRINSDISKKTRRYITF